MFVVHDSLRLLYQFDRTTRSLSHHGLLKALLNQIDKVGKKEAKKRGKSLFDYVTT